MITGIELKGTPELARALAGVKANAHLAIGAALYQEAEAIMADSKRLVPVDQGILRNSGFVNPPETYVNETTSGGSGIMVEMGYGGAAPYGLWLHEGTGPAVGRPAFFPPVAPFREWAKRVLGDESLGFVIARAVGRRGLTPRKFLETPFKARAATMLPRLARRVRGMVERGA